jgi:hypothetical protein
MRQVLILLAFITMVIASSCAHQFAGGSQEPLDPRTTIIPR